MTAQKVTLVAVTLDNPGKAQLKKLLGDDSSCAGPLCDHIIALGAQFMIIESPYTDRDYSADFMAFYAAAFKAYPRFTKRLHFFDRDVSDFFEDTLAEQANVPDDNLGYLGFVVVRPISQGPVGRTVLKFPDIPGVAVRRAARSRVHVHLLGTKLEVEGAPFIQQDTRVGACAQAAIWMASRPIYERHKQSNWHSISEITKFATTPTDPELSKSLPHGSSGLNPLHITRALRAMGHQPLCDIFRIGTEERDGADAAAADEPQACESVVRYLDSGLTVILGLSSCHGGTQNGHAITAVGYIESEGAAIRDGEGYDRFVSAIIVHDDQRGPYRLMPLTVDDIPNLPQDRLLMFGDKVATVQGDVSHIFVPLSSRVFLIADYAQIIAGDFIIDQIEELRRSQIDQIAAEVPAARTVIEQFCDDFEAGRIIRRTYLTTAGRYRHHLAASTAPEQVKTAAILRVLPHFVYVTELIRQDSGFDADGARPVLGHLVFNATSSTDPDADLLFAHLPYLAVERDANTASDQGDYEDNATLVRENHPYAQRVRR